jgi:hypothetical protein
MNIKVNAGAPVAGTDAVHTLTIGGTPTGGTFRLSVGGEVTGNITWSATNNTLFANIQAAMRLLACVGTGFTATVGTMTSGIGTVTMTFAGASGKRVVPVTAVNLNALTGTSPTLAVAETTPGVTATHYGSPKGQVLSDTTNAILYINTGTSSAPTWTKVGTQT